MDDRCNVFSDDTSSAMFRPWECAISIAIVRHLDSLTAPLLEFFFMSRWELLDSSEIHSDSVKIFQDTFNLQLMPILEC